MQTLVAYAFDRDPDPADVAARLGRVADFYASIWRSPVERHGLAGGRCGLSLWDAACSQSRWPSWTHEGDLAVASVYLPLGYEHVVGSLALDRAPLLLARTLSERPWDVLDVAPPFVVASLSRRRGRLQLHSDGLGVGRLFELRFAGGWVWSNRPAAACRFAGVRAEVDRDAWRMFAATGWFLGERSPFAGVFSVPAGTTIRYDSCGRTQSRVDTLAAWSDQLEGVGLTADRVEQVAEALTGLLSSLARAWSGDLVADLSGGRDSRLVVAAAIAAGLDVTVRTNGAEPGEADVAERLVGLLPAAAAKRVRHRVTRPTGDAERDRRADPVLANAVRWHRCQDGLRPATYLSTPAPAGLMAARDMIVSGGGGEIAHGHYYSDDYEDLERLPGAERLDAFAERLAQTVISRVGPSAAAKAIALAQVRRIVEDAFARGLADARALDYFYAAERARRWGSAGETLGRVSPLLVPAFIRAAFACSSRQRRANQLHRAVTGRLIPEWKDEPYYRRPKGIVVPSSIPRLGAARDRDAISAIVADPASWSDAFDPRAVEQSWRELLDGRGAARDEVLMQRVCWKAAFDAYLGEVNGEPVEDRVVRSSPGHPRRLRRVLRGRRFAARALRRVARALD